MQLPFLVFTAAAAVLRIADTTPPKLPEPLPQTTVTTTAPATEAVEEVLVEAPEPRYVAPNRRDRIGRVWAPVMINGKGPFRLVVDTGASGAAVIQSVVTRLGISSANTRTVRLQGVTGSAIVPTIPVDSIEVGDLLLEGKHLPIVADAFGGAEGVLGSEGFRDKRIAIDFRHDEISIMRSRKQRAEAGFIRIPLTFGRNGLPAFEASIGTIRIKAILDTGAQVTVGNNALRDLLKRRRAESGMTQIVGVTLDVAQGQVIPVATMNIGRIEVRGLRLTFGDMAIFERWKLQRDPVLLIGMDIVGSFDAMVIDYPKRELQIRTRGGA